MKKRNDQPALREARLWDGLTGRTNTIHPSPPAARPFFYDPFTDSGKGGAWRVHGCRRSWVAGPARFWGFPLPNG